MSENKWMLDRYGEPKEVEVYTREIRYTETWARALDGSFQTTVFKERLYNTKEEAMTYHNSN